MGWVKGQSDWGGGGGGKRENGVGELGKRERWDTGWRGFLTTISICPNM